MTGAYRFCIAEYVAVRAAALSPTLQMCEHKGDFGNHRYAANAVFGFAFFNAQNLGFFIPVLPAQVLQLSAPQAGQKKGLQNELISNRELLCSFFKRLLFFT